MSTVSLADVRAKTVPTLGNVCRKLIPLTFPVDLSLGLTLATFVQLLQWPANVSRFHSPHTLPRVWTGLGTEQFNRLIARLETEGSPQVRFDIQRVKETLQRVAQEQTSRPVPVAELK